MVITVTSWPSPPPTRHSPPQLSVVTLRRPTRTASSRSCGVRVNNAASRGALQISDRPAASAAHHHRHERTRLMCADCSTAIAGIRGGRYCDAMRWLWPVLLAVLVGGCATAFPESVMRTVDTRITPTSSCVIRPP